jgi:hypothetical protein
MSQASILRPALRVKMKELHNQGLHAADQMKELEGADK